MLSQITSEFIELLKVTANILPLPWFALLGSFVEEIIAPIPSPLVMMLAGSIAASKDHGFIYMGVVVLIATASKTIASYLMYLLADKAEDVVLQRFGRFLGISHKQVESIGQHLNKGRRDAVVLALLRAVPIIPTSPVSIICGMIKLNVRTYITSTFIGTFIRNVFYLAVSYTGVNAMEAIITKLDNLEMIGYVIVLLIVVGIIGYLYYQRYKDTILRKIFHHATETSTTQKISGFTDQT